MSKEKSVMDVKEKSVMDVMLLEQSGYKVETVKMPSIPRVGEIIRLSEIGQDSRSYKVLKVEYQFEGNKGDLRYQWTHVTVEELSGQG